MKKEASPIDKATDETTDKAIKVSGENVSLLLRVWLTLCWAFGFHHKLYQEKEPKISNTDAAMQALAIRFSLGRLTWGKTALAECRCKVCSRRFWTLTRSSVVCRRYSCYMKFHLHPEQYTLRRARH